MSSLSNDKSPSREWHSLKVRCYSGQTCAERPVSFTWEGSGYRVAEIEKAWLEPGERHFQVRIEDKRFRLCYNMAEDWWSLKEL